MYVDSCMVTIVNETPTLGSAVMRSTNATSGLCAYRDSIWFDSYDVTEHYHAKWTWGSNGEKDSTSLCLTFRKKSLNYTVNCDFVIDTYYVHVVPNDIIRGSATTDDTAYVYGTPCTVTATPYTGFTFHSWSNGVTANPYTFVPVENTELTAIFLAPGEEIYTVTVNSDNPAMGRATVNGGTTASVMNGETVTITATANEGYHFLRWNDNDTHAVRTITVTEDMTFTAYFEALQGIDDITTEEVNIYAIDGQIVIETEQNAEIGIYDIVGRRVDYGHKTRFDVPAAGVYLVKIGALPTQKVVVIK